MVGTPNRVTVTPDNVLETLRRHLLVDGFDLVLDTSASRGSWLVDARDGTRYLDLFSFFTSAPLGMNHPALTGDPEFRAELVRTFGDEVARFARLIQRDLSHWT